MPIGIKKVDIKKVMVKGSNDCIDVYVKKNHTTTQVFTCQITLVLDQQKGDFNLRTWIDAHNPKKFTRLKIINNLYQPAMVTGSLDPYPGTTEPLTIEFVNNPTGTIAATKPSGTAITVTDNTGVGALKITNLGWIRGGGGNGGHGGRGGTGPNKSYVYYVSKASSVTTNVPSTVTNHGTKQVSYVKWTWTSGSHYWRDDHNNPVTFHIGIFTVKYSWSNCTVTLTADPSVTVHLTIPGREGTVRGSLPGGAPVTFNQDRKGSIHGPKYYHTVTIGAGRVMGYKTVPTSSTSTVYKPVTNHISHAGAVRGTIYGGSGGSGGAGGIGQYFNHNWTKGHGGNQGSYNRGRSNDVFYTGKQSAVMLRSRGSGSYMGLKVRGCGNFHHFGYYVVIPGRSDSYPVPFKYYQRPFVDKLYGNLSGTPGYDAAAKHALNKAYTTPEGIRLVLRSPTGYSGYWFTGSPTCSFRWYNVKLEYPKKVRDYKPVDNIGHSGYRGGRGGDGGNWGAAGKNGENGVHGTRGTRGGPAGLALVGKQFLIDNGAGLVATGTSDQHLSGLAP